MSSYTINEYSTIRDALIALEGQGHDAQTLFVLDGARRLIGSLTDGDIRRGLINNAGLDDSVSVVMHKDYKFLYKSDFDNALAKKYRDNGFLFLPVIDDDRHLVMICDFLKYKAYLPVDAIIMAGGKGERLRPLTDSIPKPLLKVGDKSIIDYNIDRLISYGITNIAVTVNHLKEQIEEHFLQPYDGVLVRTYREPRFLGTIGSVKFVKDFEHDVVLLMNSDIFTNIDLEDFYLHFTQHKADISIAAIPYTVKIPFGVFELEGRNVRGIIEKPTYNYYTNAGIYLIKRSSLDEIPDDTFFNATDFIEKLISQGRTVIRYPLNGIWIDIGNPQEYEKANELVNHLK